MIYNIWVMSDCLQAASNVEYVLEAQDVQDMKSWLNTIQCCTKPVGASSSDQ